MELPIFKCVIDNKLNSDLEVEFVALVDKPAIEKNFIAFNKERLKFNVDNERRIISGPAMIADLPIYRKDDDMGEYYAVFEKASILAIAQKFFKKGYVQNFNIMHDPGKKVSDITVFESFITDEARGILPMKGFEDVADGSWFMSALVDNDDTWEAIKKGEVKGFSVEGIFQQVPVKQVEYSLETALEMCVNILKKTNLKN